jgi:hypothetical protein
LQRKAGMELITYVRVRILTQLAEFARQSHNLALEMRRQSGVNDSILHEWADGIEITGLRAQHRYYTLNYILDRREAKINGSKCNCDSLLQMAAVTRSLGQQIVNYRQLHYRYPLQSIAAKRWDHTAYHFGYLYTVSYLHAWLREEEEAKHNRYGPFYKNIYNVGRIVGLIK